MEMPVDVKKLLEEASAVDKARSLPLSVSVYFDDSASGDVQAFVRQSFASASANARVSLMYLDGRPFVPFEGDDMAVIVAGTSAQVGACAESLRATGVPAMVVTVLPDTVRRLAEESGCAIPEADLLSPADVPEVSKVAVAAQGARDVSAAAKNVQARGGRLSGAARVVSGVASTAADYLGAFAKEPSDQRSKAAGAAAESGQDAVATEPYELTDRLRAALAERMGRWVAVACKEKRLAFALAFPFARKPLASDVVSVTALQNAGVGAIMLIPGADMPIMTLNQAKMLLQIAAAYGEDLGLERLKELAAVVAGGFACRSVARQVVAVIPVGGWAVKAGVGYTGTLAMGRAAIEYFEGGANLSRVADMAADVRDTVVRVSAGKAANRVRDKGVQAAVQVRDAASTAFGKSFARKKPEPVQACGAEG